MFGGGLEEIGDYGNGLGLTRRRLRLGLRLRTNRALRPGIDRRLGQHVVIERDLLAIAPLGVAAAALFRRSRSSRRRLPLQRPRGLPDTPSACRRYSAIACGEAACAIASIVAADHACSDRHGGRRARQQREREESGTIPGRGRFNGGYIAPVVASAPAKSAPKRQRTASASLLLDAARLDQLRPLLLILVDERGVIFRRARGDVGAVGAQLPPHLV